MSESCYNYCNSNIGKIIKIEDDSGRIYAGKIMKVDKDKVYIRELKKKKDLGGFGYGYGRGFFNPFISAFFNPLIFTSFLTPIFFDSIIDFTPFSPFI